MNVCVGQVTEDGEEGRARDECLRWTVTETDREGEEEGRARDECLRWTVTETRKTGKGKRKGRARDECLRWRVTGKERGQADREGEEEGEGER